MDSDIYPHASYKDAGHERKLTGTRGKTIYSSALQLLLLAGILALEMPQVLGHLDTDAITGTANQLHEMWYEVRPRQPRRQCPELFAVCLMKPSLDLPSGLPSVSGHVLFHHKYPHRLEAYFQVSGFPQDPSQPARAIHVHQYGDVSASCLTTGPHFNPMNVNHPQHPGDFNNFQVSNGRIVKRLTNLRASLYGKYSILGRGVVIHEHEDDLGLGGDQASLQHGNSGRRLACCTIGLSKGDLWRNTVRNRRRSGTA
ncbi:extracellular superoxide dismutase [Cu-Zn]-like [Heterodontus francisci]|uniref:extracellular superoxide dismutase [Cu-Zn]-like n=1 Tax=Heterodontus francisci TaxID=7792 RepID=UPI00355AD1E4